MVWLVINFFAGQCSTCHGIFAGPSGEYSLPIVVNETPNDVLCYSTREQVLLHAAIMPAKLYCNMICLI